ncbi:MAG TPA: class I SAM-dependent methyltransferase [Thermoplasmata archaeon]|nr:class I SAM-dependent methyltransferase [Thermoplasmata archaeon]
MPEMNRVSRWFVNHVKGRSNSRLYSWLQGHLVLPPGAVCLEVGCGNGNMAVRIMDGMSPARMVATDIDLAQIEAADRLVREHYPTGLPTGLELRPADMTQLPFPNEGFDAVFAFASLHHTGGHHRDPGQVPTALSEIDRVLRPSGYLAYEEVLHRDLLKSWLRAHQYTVAAFEHRWRRDLMVAQKPPPPVPLGSPPRR